MASLSLKNDAAPSAFTPSAQPEFGKKLAKKKLHENGRESS
jgi:hypothetical protein